jgi:hypothetical protein
MMARDCVAHRAALPKKSPMPPRRPPPVLPPKLQWLLLVPLALVFALVLVGSVAMVMSSVPDEAKLVTLKGRLDGMQVAKTKDGELVFTLEIKPASGDMASVHLRAYGSKDPTEALSRAEGQDVVVRYRKLPFGNRAYAIAGPDGDIVSFAATRRFLEAEDAAKGPEKWGGLVLYGLCPLLMAALIWWGQRTRPVPEPTSAERTSHAALAHRLVQARSWACLMWLMVIVLIGLGGVPADVTRVFGPRPLGLPPMTGYLALTAIALAPLAWGAWHLMVALVTMQHRDGIFRPGKLGIARGLFEHWDDPAIRSHTRHLLAGVAVFLVLMTTWIIASA